MNQGQVSEIVAVQALARHITDAYEKSALFFLAVHLKSLLEEHQKVNGPPTSIEMEELIAVAAKVMMGEADAIALVWVAKIGFQRFEEANNKYTSFCTSRYMVN